MIKILIIEDEIPARKKLKRFIEELDTATEVVAEIDTVETAIEFLKNRSVDLIFSDIELLDGNAFEIYKQASISCPIIFTTAYDQFLMNAFESNGIEYLLKPFSQARFQKAWDKFLLLQHSNTTDDSLMIKLKQLLKNTIDDKIFKKQFAVNKHQKIYFIKTNDISFFEANEGVLFAVDKLGEKHLLNETTLKQIEAQLDPTSFFKINRSELVNRNHIISVERYSKNSLSLRIKDFPKHLVTSQSKTASFREWIER